MDYGTRRFNAAFTRARQIIITINAVVSDRLVLRVTRTAGGNEFARLSTGPGTGSSTVKENFPKLFIYTKWFSYMKPAGSIYACYDNTKHVYSPTPTECVAHVCVEQALNIRHGAACPSILFGGLQAYLLSVSCQHANYWRENIIVSMVY